MILILLSVQLLGLEFLSGNINLYLVLTSLGVGLTLIYTRLLNNNDAKLKIFITNNAPYVFILSYLVFYINEIITHFHYIKVISFTTTMFLGLLSFLGLGTKGVDEKRNEAITPNTNKIANWKTLLVLSAIICVGVYLRVKGIQELSLWVDEVNSIIVSEQIANGHGQTLLSGEPYTRAYVYHHLLAIFLKIFGNPDVTGRLLNIPFFILSAVYIYKFGRYIKNNTVGLLSAALFSFSWFGISMARDLRFYEMFLSLFLVFSYTLMVTLIEYYNLERNQRIFPTILRNKKIRTGGIIAVVLGLIAFDTQVQTVLVLYPLIVFGVLLSIFHNLYAVQP